MSILVDWELRQLIRDGKLKILPLGDNAIQPNSIDIHLSDKFATYRPSLELIDPYDKDSINLGLIDIQDTKIQLHKNGFLLAETLEYIELPDDVCATIEGKSSLARLGITIHQTGGWIDCGFAGTITLEMTNENNRPVLLRAGMPIGQIVFYQTHPAEIPYSRKVDAKYYKQNGPTGSMYYKNKQR